MLLSIFGASQERGPTDDFWYQDVPFRAGAAFVTPARALRLTAVYASVRVLAESFAVLPFKLYRPSADGLSRQLVTDHWLYTLFAKRPNRWQNPYAWIEMLQGHLALRGNAFCQIVDDNKGGIAELVPLHPDRIKIELLGQDSWRYRFTRRDGSIQYFTRREIWHLRGLSDDGMLGYNPIEIAREAIAGGLAAQAYANRFFANNANPGGWIKMPGKFESKEKRREFRENWQEAQGGDNQGKTAVLENGMEYHQLLVNNKDSQFLESRQFSVADIARLFRVPPHKIGDLTRSTNNNIEHQGLEFWIDTMLPWTARWESSIECELLGPDSGLQVEFDYKRLLRGDAASRAAYLTRMVAAGILTRNEARAVEGYNPLDGLDEPLTPQNMSVGADHEEAVQTPAKGKDKPEPADDEAAAQAEARVNALLKVNAERVTRRLMASLRKQPVAEVFNNALASLISENLLVPEPKAKAWCGWAAANAAEPDFEATCMASLMATATGVPA